MSLSPETMQTESAPVTEGRAVVAMSGGVDSSVVAAMLHAEGHDVVGVSMRLYATAEGAGKSCCSPDDLFDARQVATDAGFPFYVVNYQEAFQQRIVDYFVSEYRRGRTPSPCILCNDHLKFDVLLERMRALGGSFLATGHYARIEKLDDRFALLRGVDRRKDQSYFLFGLKRPSLAELRFPLGGMTKADVRDRGRALQVPTADKAESQDICFVAGGDYADFVEARLSPDEIRPGRFILASNGDVVGEHTGVHRFTIGQRRGLGISHPVPLYVKAIDASSGDVTVGTAEEIGQKRFTLSRCNWLRWETPPASFEADVQVRYRHRAQPCRAEVEGDRVSVTLVGDERGISPGQAAVFYDGDEVLGGGWIEEVA